MKNKKVSFFSNGTTVIGTIQDKVNIPIASGTNEYVPMDNYLIVDESGNTHIVNPISIKQVLPDTASNTEFVDKRKLIKLIKDRISTTTAINGVESLEKILHDIKLNF